MHLTNPLLLLLLPAFTTALSLTFTLPPQLSLTGGTTASLISHSHPTISVPLTRRNTFEFFSITFPPSISFPSSGSSTGGEGGQGQKQTLYLHIHSPTYDIATYALAPAIVTDGVVKEVEVYRTGAGGVRVAEGVRVSDGGVVEARVLRVREVYQDREGFNPMTLLKNPMVLIGVVGLAVVMGMPYLMENMDPETRREFEEASKKSVLTGGASKPNPLQDFDMAAWMAGTQKKTTTSSEVGVGSSGGGGEGTGTGGGSGGGTRRRG